MVERVVWRGRVEDGGLVAMVAVAEAREEVAR